MFELEEIIPDVLGFCSRRPDAAVIRVMQGCDARSVCVLVPGSVRALERGFHDVAIVDMEDSAEPAVSEDYLSLLRRQWPATAMQNMTWMQNDLDEMRAAAKKLYRNSRPGDCSCKWIKCDMYRHVSTFHLDPGQLWRCLVSWCTVWEGTPQDCMDHVCGAQCAFGHQICDSGPVLSALYC